MLKVCVIDGQGGGMGSLVIKRLKELYWERVEVWALGTNAIATARMMKANANRGATGENAIIHSAAQADVIIGPLSIVLANAMMGEVTPAMAAAVASCQGIKLLLPLNQERVEIVGQPAEPLPRLVEYIASVKIKELLSHV